MRKVTKWDFASVTSPSLWQFYPTLWCFPNSTSPAQRSNWESRGHMMVPCTLLFAHLQEDLTNNGLGNCEAEKGEEEHNYDYVDENTIENLRQIFQGTTVRNKHASSEGRRCVRKAITTMATSEMQYVSTTKYIHVLQQKRVAHAFLLLREWYRTN
ncbi:hypothetical protein Q9966_014484 [Columba livia]|nr:hypothetical protein Q9966_014484 [Columba livia]